MIQEEILKQIKSGAVVRVYSAGGGSLPVPALPAGRRPASTRVERGEQAGASRGEGTSVFKGLVIARKHGRETGATFTVRAILAGVGVEKIFPIHSPAISKVEIISSPKKVHRAKLYFVRKISSKKIRQKLGVSI